MELRINEMNLDQYSDYMRKKHGQKKLETLQIKQNKRGELLLGKNQLSDFEECLRIAIMDHALLRAMKR